MASNWKQVASKFRKDEAFTKAFLAVYPDGYNKENFTDAIAEFERTLVTPDSKFDRYLKGDADALDADEKAGYELFLAKGCATCHVGKLLGGQSYEKMGRHADYFAARGGALTDADAGRYNVTKKEEDRHEFKVPTLRNIALTYPYFHDGSTSDLAEAVRIMAKVELDEAFTKAEVDRIVKFLKAQTGTWRGKPLD